MQGVISELSMVGPYIRYVIDGEARSALIQFNDLGSAHTLALRLCQSMPDLAQVAYDHYTTIRSAWRGTLRGVERRTFWRASKD
jgi:hypothetical protein